LAHTTATSATEPLDPRLGAFKIHRSPFGTARLHASGVRAVVRLGQ
jgi:hypothetical protein